MTYTRDVPKSGETLGGTRVAINTNFDQNYIVQAINHIAFNELDKGKHKYLQMPEVTVSGAGVPATAANEGGVYCEVGTNPSETNLFFRGESNGKEYQLTKAISTAPAPARFGTNTAYVANHTGGWTFLPGGLVLQYGIRSGVSGSSSGSITFPISFPSGNAPFSITATLQRTSGRPVAIDSAIAITSTGFNYQLDSSSSVAIQWIAIGN